MKIPWDSVSLPYIAVGAGATAFGFPALLTYLGFTSSGITAGTFAAWLMKMSAIYNGGAVPAGGLVAILQSLGATLTTKGLAIGGGTAGYLFYQTSSCDKKGKSTN
ncbi:interferon alpha-inducible protein 6 [Rhinatrema bivittatum]|uniref:interferon alpha-inducible protein 6 n=1 Tax=Rhinatrema bivittatum TaxID=194408 RepID=UPI001125CFC7|nr:interferon alpha-inducible protein 6 [Rhinatrema bivittatum]